MLYLFQMISCVALMIQSYLVTEDENEKINSGSEVFELLVKLLDNAINKTTYNGLSFAPIEVLEVSSFFIYILRNFWSIFTELILCL